ncbi:alpha/beta-hydrolase [Pleomassaria siparia CBS 279.74]|uniref:Alpha/beta-hydrolase n=1 Tax=Pleomassaria siparia CBS 279.74 TaxID=1314801 RepID=A0A6G1KM48_9PLEO|nr:alpha/beta-hydrolase [Pleomassaria siparia CBS 279.74]
MPETYDHDNKPATHGMARVNGIRLHYIITGTSSKPALLLLHGTPKTHYYWYKIIPFLSPHFRIIAPDLRGFGATDKPPASDGYDGATNAKDMIELMDQLGHQKFAIHSEDRGGTFGYCLAGLFPDRVTHLSFCEMVLGDRLTEQSFFTRGNVSGQFEQTGVWNWHIPFFWMPHIPEMLIQGREKEFWTYFIRAECYNPHAIEQHAIDEWVRCSQEPGGLRGILETYRAHWVNVDIEAAIQKTGKLKCPIMTVGAPEFFGPLVKEQMQRVSDNVMVSDVFERCGHSLSLEQPERLAELLKRFIT